VTLIALVGTGSTALNLLWPRASTNPNLDQITGTVTDSAFRHISMGWYIVGVPILIGIVYYAVRQRKIDARLEAEEQRQMVSGRGELVAD